MIIVNSTTMMNLQWKSELIQTDIVERACVTFINLFLPRSFTFTLSCPPLPLLYRNYFRPNSSARSSYIEKYFNCKILC